MESEHTFNRSLHQWVAMYAQSETKYDEDQSFKEVFKIVREMQAQKILKPIIFYQLMMTFQALACVAGLRFTEFKIKKILALLYSENTYVTELTEQVLSAVNNAEHSSNEYDGEPVFEQPIRRVNTHRSGPPPGPIS